MQCKIPKPTNMTAYLVDEIVTVKINGAEEQKDAKQKKWKSERR